MIQFLNYYYFFWGEGGGGGVFMMGVVMNHRDCAFIISLVDNNFSTFDYDLHNDHNSLLIIIDHNNVKIEKLLRKLLM